MSMLRDLLIDSHFIINMKRILFIDDAKENSIPRYDIVSLPVKVQNSTNVKIDFRDCLPNLKESFNESGIVYEVPEFNNYDLIFLHTSYDKPLVPSKVISDLLYEYVSKLYCFAGTFVPNKNGLSRKGLYNNFSVFVKMINNFNQIEIALLQEGPENYLQKKYNELLDDIEDPVSWKTYLTDNWWFILQDSFKLESRDIQTMKVEFQEIEDFSDFDNRLQEISNQSYRRLFL